MSAEIRAAFRRGDSAAAMRLAEAELGRARAAGEPDGQVEAWYMMARVALRDGDLALAGERAETALAVAAGSGAQALEERPRHVLAAVARLSGDLLLARDRYLASIALNVRLGQPEQVRSESYNLAFVELHLGNRDRARELFTGCRERAPASFVPYPAIGFAALAAADGDHPRAARMIGVARTAFAAIGEVPDPDDAAELERVAAAAVAALGAERFAAERAAGAVLNPTVALNDR